MFEFNLNQNIALSVTNHFDECALSQERSVPTDRQTFLEIFKPMSFLTVKLRQSGKISEDLAGCYHKNKEANHNLSLSKFNIVQIGILLPLK